MTTGEGTRWHEEARFLPIEDGRSVMTFWSRPDGEVTGPAIVIVPGGWHGTSMGRNRMIVRMSRRLTEAGHLVVRYDFEGVGDSTGTPTSFRLSTPPLEDLQVVLASLRDLGIASIALVGVCLGGRSAIEEAGRMGDVAGVALLSPPINDGADPRSLAKLSLARTVRFGLRPWVIRGLFDREQRRYYAKFVKAKWRTLVGRKRRSEGTATVPAASSRLLDPLESLVERAVPVLFVFGSTDVYWDDFRAARAGRLGSLLRKADDRVEVRELVGGVHALADLFLQDQVIDLVAEWVDTLAVPTEVVLQPKGMRGGDDHQGHG